MQERRNHLMNGEIMASIPTPAEQPYPDFTGMSKEEKVDAMVAYIANASDKKMVTLPEPIVFLHENGSTSTLG
jgi:hypothetical protein